jgi:hypothetical protein
MVERYRLSKVGYDNPAGREHPNLRVVLEHAIAGIADQNPIISLCAIL